MLRQTSCAEQELVFGRGSEDDFAATVPGLSDSSDIVDFVASHGQGSTSVKVILTEPGERKSTARSSVDITTG